MVKDLSRLFFYKYTSLKNQNINVILRNGESFRGVIVGFVRGNSYRNEPFIVKWHLTEEGDKTTLGFDVFGHKFGKIIDHKDISGVHFEEDNSIMTFYRND